MKEETPDTNETEKQLAEYLLKLMDNDSRKNFVYYFKAGNNFFRYAINCICFSENSGNGKEEVYAQNVMAYLHDLIVNELG